MVVDFLVGVAHVDGDVEVYDLQTERVVDEEVVGLDVPVGDAVLVEIRQTPDEAPADRCKVRRKLLGIVPQPVFHVVRYLGEDDPRRALPMEGVAQCDDVVRRGAHAMEEPENLELVRLLPDFLRDEQCARVRSAKHGQEIGRQLERGCQCEIAERRCATTNFSKRLECAVFGLDAVWFHVVTMGFELVELGGGGGVPSWRRPGTGIAFVTVGGVALGASTSVK